MTAQQEKLLHEVNSNLKKLLTKTPETVWLTAGEVMQRTGWSREQLRHRREKGFIRFEITGNLVYKYDASSIPVKP